MPSRLPKKFPCNISLFTSQWTNVPLKWLTALLSRLEMALVRAELERFVTHGCTNRSTAQKKVWPRIVMPLVKQ